MLLLPIGLATAATFFAVTSIVSGARREAAEKRGQKRADNDNHSDPEVRTPRADRRGGAVVFGVPATLLMSSLHMPRDRA
jgi:hypothetical protein